MVKFANNNTKNASTSHMPFKLNCGYYFRVFFEKDNNSCSQLKPANKLSIKLQELITICQKNLHHIQELQKQAYNKGVKLRSYALGNKI